MFVFKKLMIKTLQLTLLHYRSVALHTSLAHFHHQLVFPPPQVKEK